MYFLCLLLFLVPVITEAEVIYTPYYEVNHALENKELEKEVLEKRYLLENIRKPTRNYYSLENAPKNMVMIEDDFIDMPFSKWQEDCSEKMGEVIWKTKTWYQELKSVEAIFFQSNHDLFIDHIKLLDGNDVTLFEEKQSFYLKANTPKKIVFPKKISLEDKTISFRVFLRQEDQEATIQVVDDQAITKNTFSAQKKGYTIFFASLLEQVDQYLMTDVKTTLEEMDWTYKRILKQKKLCKVRERKYRFQPLKRQVFCSSPFKKGFTVIDEETIKKVYRREKIVLKDNLVTKTPYLLVDDFLEDTSFPPKDLIFSYSPFDKEGTYPVTFFYKDFQFTRFFTYLKK